VNTKEEISDWARKTYNILRGKGQEHAAAVATVLQFVPTILASDDPEELTEIGALLDRLPSSGGGGAALPGDDEHEEWFTPALKADWRRWQHYRQFLLNKGWPFNSVATLDDVSDQLIALLEDPRKKAGVKGRSFDRRGLVVGNVQSGKTANFMATMSKALDAGYKVVIVLAGIHNSLRHQTQTRIDEEVLGVATDLDNPAAKKQLGVGLMDGHPGHQYLTGQGENGDFSIAVASKVGVHLGDTPLVLVVKKNVTVLENLVKYLRSLPVATKRPGTHPIINDVPLLLIDDEADQASVNFKGPPGESDSPETDPSEINKRVRAMLMSFNQRCYLGYTATPFANIFIDSEAEHPTLGPDLFPRSFIFNLFPPDNYIGPVQVFGLGPQADDDRKGLPVVRVIEDNAQFMPEGHKINWVAKAVPPSLREAILAYLLAGAIRMCRGQAKHHHTMLVHVTRYTGLQQRVGFLVGEQVKRIREIVELRSGAAGTPDSYEALAAELRSLFDGDFEKTSKAMSASLPAWDQVEAQLAAVVKRVEVRTINGDVGDVLDYDRQRETGFWVVAVGGDKLSRGLTLEGLAVSYYLRASKLYDTLMQMGRWFGYRPGYADVCRIYSTAELISWFEQVTIASEELREEFEVMRRQGSTPREFGLRVRAHPVMEVTSPLKMRDGEKVALSYDGTISETTVFDPTASTVAQNLACIQSLVEQLGPVGRRGGETKGGAFLWDDVDAAAVLAFFDGYQSPPEAPRANPKRIASYIRRQIPKGGLVSWTVGLISQAKASDMGTVGVGPIVLNRLKRSALVGSGTQRLSIRRIASPGDELLDLTGPERQELEAHLAGSGRELRGIDARGIDRATPTPKRLGRPPSRGLLLVYPLAVKGFEVPGLAGDATAFGFAVSFPRVADAERVEYVVNRVWLDQE
jgi:hypothetical protein